MTRAAAPDLRQLQRWFASVTTHPDGVIEGHLGRARRQKLERLVTRGPQLSAFERVQIYNDGYFARLVDCLADDYPALFDALGPDTFSELAREYIDEHPSRSRSLNAFGQQLSTFCRCRSEPWAPFAADLARLEWALVEVVHEPMSDSLAPDMLARIPSAHWQTARLLATPALRVLGFDYPVNEFFQAFRDGRERQMPERSPTAAAVYRRGLALWRMSLEPRAASLLVDLLGGMPLGAAVSTLELRNQAAGEELAQLLPQWLGSWVQSGFFRGVELS